MTCVREEEED